MEKFQWQSILWKVFFDTCSFFSFSHLALILVKCLSWVNHFCQLLAELTCRCGSRISRIFVDPGYCAPLGTNGHQWVSGDSGKQQWVTIRTGTPYQAPLGCEHQRAPDIPTGQQAPLGSGYQRATGITGIPPGHQAPRTTRHQWVPNQSLVGPCITERIRYPNFMLVGPGVGAVCWLVSLQ